MKQARVSFPSGELFLEGILAIPEGAGPFPAVIVCHPHPLYGGSMDNNVVYSLFEALTQASLASLKFNFRGVGGSQGEFGQGIGEQEDVEAAISLNDVRIKAMAAVSPPLSMFDFDFLKVCPKPKLLISGGRDNFTSADQFLKFCQNLPEPKEYESIEGADHFWWGYESRLATKVTAFFIKVL